MNPLWRVSLPSFQMSNKVEVVEHAEHADPGHQTKAAPSRTRRYHPLPANPGQNWSNFDDSWIE